MIRITTSGSVKLNLSVKEGIDAARVSWVWINSSSIACHGGYVRRNGHGDEVKQHSNPEKSEESASFSFRRFAIKKWN